MSVALVKMTPKRVMLRFIISLIILAILYKPVFPNSCDNAYRTLPFEDDRYLNNVVDDTYTLIDDNFLREGWYKSTHRMLEYAPSSPFVCGTKFPIYVNGSLPTESGNQVNRTACIKGSTNCTKTIEIQIIHCNTYFMYHFQPTRVHKTAYCLGIGVEGEKPEFVPQDRPIVRARLFDKEDDPLSSETVFICDFQASTNETLMFKVQWYQNGVYKYQTPGGRNSSDRSLHLTEEIFKEKSFTLGTNLSCSYFAYIVENGPKSKRSNVSEQLFIGVQVLTPSLTIDASKENVSNILLRATIPFGCYAASPCSVCFVTYLPNQDTEGECQGLAFENSACGICINSDTFSDIIKLPVKVKDNGQFNTRTHYQVYLRTEETLENNIWENYALPTISVTLTKNTNGADGSRCWIFNDPHIRSFDVIDEWCYDDHSEGTKIAYKNTLYNTEVQIKYKPCNSESDEIKCLCGVAVRAGYDVYIYNVCEYSITIGYVYCSEHKRTFTVSWDEHTLKIYFDYGTYLTVNLGSNPLDLLDSLAIYPTINDRDKTRGLCGIYNDNKDDDFHLQDGSILNESPAPYGQPTRFLNEWRVNETNDLFSESFKTTNLQPYVYIACVCENSTVQAAAAASTGKLTESVPCKTDGAATCRRGRLVDTPPRCTLHNRRRRSNKEFPRRQAAVTVNNVFKKMITNREKRETQETFTLEEAEQMCRNHFSGASAYNACLKVQNAATETFLQACAVDVVLMNSTTWIDINFNNMFADCIEETTRNITILKDQNNEDSLFNEINNHCKRNCSNRGICQNGSCICEPNVGGPDCTIDLSMPPTLGDLYNGGLCDRAVQTCTSYEVFGGVFSESSTLLCKSHFFEINQNGQRVNRDPYVGVPVYVSPVELICQLAPSDSLFITSEHFVSGYTLTVTNNGEIYSESKDLLVFNSECQAVENRNGTYVFALIDGYCYIDNQCVAHGRTDPNNICNFCDAYIAPRAWSVNETQVECQKASSTTSKGELLQIVLIPSIIGGIVLLFIVIFKAVVCFNKRNRINDCANNSVSDVQMQEVGEEQLGNSGDERNYQEIGNQRAIRDAPRQEESQEGAYEQLGNSGDERNYQEIGNQRAIRDAPRQEESQEGAYEQLGNSGDERHDYETLNDITRCTSARTIYISLQRRPTSAS